jgi:hypothetical protein
LHNTIIDVGHPLEAPREDANTDETKLQRIGVVKNNLMLTDSFFRDENDAEPAAPFWEVDSNLYPVSRDNITLWVNDGDQPPNRQTELRLIRSPSVEIVRQHPTRTNLRRSAT